MICPVCKNELIIENKCYKCNNGHSYDIAKEGYINLLLNRTMAGDDKTLVNGRINFLKQGYYEPLKQFLENLLADFSPEKSQKLLDMGCGTGYYTQGFANYCQTFGLDISKNAIKYASKHDKNTTYIIASNKSVPFLDNYFDILVHIFSPFFENEDNRLLKNDGLLILVEPGPKHLIELKNILYKKPYLNEEKSHSYKTFKEINHFSLTYSKEINNIDINNLVMMTPYFYTTKKDVISSLKIDKNIILTIDFSITIFKPNF